VGNRPGAHHAQSADVAAQDRRFRIFVQLWLPPGFVSTGSWRILLRSTASAPRVNVLGLTVIQRYALIVLSLSGTTLLLRLLGCVLYAFSQWWKSCPCFPLACRLCRCCGLAQRGGFGDPLASEVEVEGTGFAARTAMPAHRTPNPLRNILLAKRQQTPPAAEAPRQAAHPRALQRFAHPHVVIEDSATVRVERGGCEPVDALDAGQRSRRVAMLLSAT